METSKTPSPLSHYFSSKVSSPGQISLTCFASIHYRLPQPLLNLVLSPSDSVNSGSSMMLPFTHLLIRSQAFINDLSQALFNVLEIQECNRMGRDER